MSISTVVIARICGRVDGRLNLLHSGRREVDVFYIQDY